MTVYFYLVFSAILTYTSTVRKINTLYIQYRYENVRINRHNRIPLYLTVDNCNFVTFMKLRKFCFESE